MTRRVAEEVHLRREGGHGRKARNLLEDLGRFLMAKSIERGAVDPVSSTWPSEKYRNDPVAFFREVLGIEPWSRQVEMIEAVRDHKRVAVRSGHKVSKSCTIAGIALWYFCTFPDAQVIMTSTTSRQVDEILWQELRMLHARALVDVEGDLADKARTGLRSDDFRKVVGFTAREAEAVAGVSGRNLLYLLDEASGIDEVIFEAIKGNRMGGARIAMFGNPTKNEGEFFDAFHSKADLWKTMTVSSEESPNFVARREVIRGLADRETIEEYEKEYGRDSAWYTVRILGKHATSEEGKVISIHEITQAEERWHVFEAVGRLTIGIDPAGVGGKGDESAFAIRRGMKVIAVEARRGLSEDDHLAHVQGIIKQYGLPGELANVLIDSEGAEGARVYNRFRAEVEGKPEGYRPFNLVRIRSSENASREPLHFDKVRDELWENARRWVRAGGAIPTDKKLARELHTPIFLQRVGPKAKVTPKPEMKKLLGHSPDRADAVCLAVWDPVDHSAQIEEQRKQDAAQSRAHVERDDDIPEMDPYAVGVDPWAGR